MNYIDQLNAFCVKSAGILSPGAVSLYVRLFQLNNQHNWAQYFPASYSLLKMLMGIESNNSISRWQQELIDGGYIECKKGGGKGAGKKPNLYRLIPLYDEKRPTGVQTGVKTGAVTGVKVGVQTGVKTGDIKNININKNIKKSASHSKKKLAAFSPPTLDDVQKYVSEKGLPVDAARFFEYYEVAKWHDSRGKPVKNWKQKCLTWARKDSNGEYAGFNRSNAKKGRGAAIDRSIDDLPGWEGIG